MSRRGGKDDRSASVKISRRHEGKALKIRWTCHKKMGRHCNSGNPMGFAIRITSLKTAYAPYVPLTNPISNLIYPDLQDVYRKLPEPKTPNKVVSGNSEISASARVTPRPRC